MFYSFFHNSIWILCALYSIRFNYYCWIIFCYFELFLVFVFICSFVQKQVCVYVFCIYLIYIICDFQFSIFCFSYCFCSIKETNAMQKEKRIISLAIAMSIFFYNICIITIINNNESIKKRFFVWKIKELVFK